MRSPLTRRLVAALVLICQIGAGLALHAPAAYANKSHVKAEASASGGPAAQKPQPCHEQAAVRAVDETVKPPVKAPAAAQPVNPDSCCKDGTCKCAVAKPAAAQSPAVAPAPACSPERADSVCPAPPSRLRPSIFFRPPI